MRSNDTPAPSFKRGGACAMLPSLLTPALGLSPLMLASLRACGTGALSLLQRRAFAAQVATVAYNSTVEEEASRYRSHLLVPRFKALLVDAAGTLLSPSEPAAQVYLRYAAPAGVCMSETDVLRCYRKAYNTPWGRSTIRYVGDGKPFWRHIVSESLGGCTDEKVFEEIYDYYARGEAWNLSPGAVESLERIRAAGVKTAVVSNFDTRLRRILKELKVDHLFDSIVISAELAAEKPNPVIFQAACEQLGVEPSEAVHVGDDRRNDLYGARDAGCFAWLWGQDVRSFADVERRLQTGNYFDSLDGV